MKIRNIVRIFVLIAGIGLCAYPLVASLIEKSDQSKVVATYENKMQVYEKEHLAQMLKRAEEYNECLHDAQNTMVSNEKNGILNSENYLKLLSFSGTSVMGVIEIPEIDVNLPIYHGTEEDVLSVGVGHLEGTSLPVGGANTHCVLTGHRGLPNAKLFTRLDELEYKDLFYIKVGEKISAYSVCEIQVINPEDVSGLAIKGGKDLVSLLTCTPYGINSHRLVVTGERIEYKQIEHDSIEPQVASKREIIFALLPFIMIGVVATKFTKERRERKYANKKQNDCAAASNNISSDTSYIGICK